MALNATQALQLSALLSNLSYSMAGPYSSQGRMAQSLLQSAQSGIQAEAIKKAKKEQEKKSKGGLFGSIGGALGTVAGLALAPVTGGASLALAGAAGGALGSAAGQALGGGGIDGGQVALAGLNGGFQGYGFGKSGLAEQVVQGTTPPPVSLSQQVTQDLPKSFEYPGTMVGRAIPANAEASFQKVGMNGVRRMSPIAKPVEMMSTTARAGFPKRFGNALSYMMTPQVRPAPMIEQTQFGYDLVRGL